MDGTTVIFLMLLFWLIVIFVISRIADGKPLPENKDGTMPYKVKANYIEGLDNLVGQYKCFIANLDDNLLIDVKSNKLKIELPYDKIISIGDKVESHQETNIHTKNKSPITRSIVGGALAGTTGAIVGGISGLNSKIESETYTVNENYLIIKYRSDDNIEKTLIFHIIEGNCLGLIKYVNKKIGNIIENTTIRL